MTINNILNNHLPLPTEIINEILMDFLLKPKLFYMMKFREVVREIRALINYNNVGEVQKFTDYYYSINPLYKFLKYLQIENKWDYKDKEVRVALYTDPEKIPYNLRISELFWDFETLIYYRATFTMNLFNGKVDDIEIKIQSPFTETYKKNIPKKFFNNDKFLMDNNKGKMGVYLGKGELIPVKPSFYVKGKNRLRIFNRRDGVMPLLTYLHDDLSK